MKVVLLTDVKKAGRKGDVVDVAEGYARNYLLPKKLAAFANEAVLKTMAQEKKQSEKKADMGLKQMRGIASRLSGMGLFFSLPAATGGRLYAALKDSEILARIKELEPWLPEGALIKDYQPIKTVGEYGAKLKFSKYEASVKITVTAKE
ncbi:MAG: 50S ribosomal protein L9 [Candidatus Doudnabacteria bacterium]|nr:50S ribosomal protein L9 [bacterium]MDZ4244090.1 50S ribosomal protein L9 [Candidatus Doudnabacteria bacterium]